MTSGETVTLAFIKPGRETPYPSSHNARIEQIRRQLFCLEPVTPKSQSQVKKKQFQQVEAGKRRSGSAHAHSTRIC
jgi:hypothetical protein